MRDELIKRLWECASGECFNCSQYTETTNVSVCSKELMRQAADAIEELVSNADKFKWISVKERLPEQKLNQNTLDFEYVLCATTFGDVRPYKFGRRIGQGEPHFWNGAGHVDTYVTHWMPLPILPSEG